MFNRKKANYAEFLLYAKDLLKHPEILRLEYYPHHIGCTRLQHSVNVAYMSYKMAVFFNLDYISALRGGLMHDMFYYDYKESGMGIIAHSSLHPKIACENASKICELNPVEKDIILKHMWLTNYKFPRYKESYIVTLADKICALCEASQGIYHKLRYGSLRKIKSRS